jgi:hypothetical protein
MQTDPKGQGQPVRRARLHPMHPERRRAALQAVRARPGPQERPRRRERPNRQRAALQGQRQRAAWRAAEPVRRQGQGQSQLYQACCR